MPQSHIAIVGAGLVGAGWSIVFARAGRQVKIYDASTATRGRVASDIAAALAAMQRHGLVDNPDAVLRNLSVVDTVADAVTSAEYVQESVFETIPVKTEVSLEIDRYLGPDAIVGSSTSGFPASTFTEACANRARFLVAHPVNPPHLVPIVELVPAPWTAPEAVTKTRALMDSVGQAPITVNREIDGFILNRLQGAVLDEAFSLYAQGYASAADIDATISKGLGLRWSFMGPFETIDLNAPKGIGEYTERFRGMYHRLASTREPIGPWNEKAMQGATEEMRARYPVDDLNARRTWRDERLMALRAHQQKARE